MQKFKSILIIGAGGHGQVVAEVAKACGYETIAFLDDEEPNAIGKIEEATKIGKYFGSVIVAIGNNILRRDITEMLKQNKNIHLATLIHPSAYVSPSAQIGNGTVILPKAVVNTRSKVGEGCIISVGAIVDHDCVVENYCHINAGVVCSAGSKVVIFTKKSSNI